MANIAKAEAEATVEHRTSNSGGLGVARWTFDVRYSLNLIPNFIQLGKIDISKPFAPRSKFVFQPITTRHEFIRSILQRVLRVEFAFARKINDREKQIADFIFK